MTTRMMRLLLLAAGAFFIAGCDGDNGAAGAAGAAGADGQDALDTGTISVTVTSGGNSVEGATVSTNPASATALTDATGVAAIAGVPIGVYEVLADIGGIVSSQTGVGVAAGATTDVALSLSGVPGTVTGAILAPDGTPVVGATVSAPGSMDAVTDAAGAFAIDAVVSEFLSVTPPAGSTLLKGGTRVPATAGGIVDIALSGGPPADATFVGSDICALCHGGGLVDAWKSSGHYRVVERSLEEMDLNGWPDAPVVAGTCSDWFDTGVVANIPGEPSTEDTETHPAYIRTCFDDPESSFEVLFDSAPLDVFGVEDLVVPVYATYGGPGTAAGEIAELQARDLATEIHGAWKQRYMVSIADLGACPDMNPDGTAMKNPKPGWVDWDTTATCEDMLMLPIQFNQRTLKWVSYHQWEWYEQRRAYSKKCSGCHEVGITLTADADGFVTEYSAVEYRVGCEKCHGPGSSHIAGGGDPNAIMNPNHMSVVDAVNVCGQCHSRGADPAPSGGAFGFPWRSDVADFDGNFVAGLHTLDYDAVDAPEGYFFQKPGNWPTGFPSKHRQQYNSYLNSAHIDNPFYKLACNDCHSPHSGRGGPYQFTNEDFGGNEFLFKDNSNALMSNVRCLGCHAGFGPWATLSKDDIAVYHISRGGNVDKNGVALAPDMAEQTSAEDLVEQAVKTHSGESAGMPLAPYLPENSHIPDNFQIGEGPVGRCTSCHMTKTAKSGSWFVDGDGLYIAGDNSDHSFEVVTVQANTNQPNTCGSCHASFRTKVEAAGGD